MKKRIFAAIDISEEARRQVARYIENLRKAFPEARAGWEKTEKLHLTLKFIGEVEEERLAAFLRAINETGRQVSSFKLQIAGAGVFPSPRNARILWLGLKDEAGSLQRLNEILEREGEREGFAREKRRFKPHLTIGRIKLKPDESLIRRHLNGDFKPSAVFDVPEIVVYQSELLPGGSRYKAISRAVLNSVGK